MAKTTENDRSLALVILAAGRGQRLKSSIPKVLHPVCGKPALWHVLHTAMAAGPTKVVIVVGHGADDVRATVEAWHVSPKPAFVEQPEQLGTGHAVMVAEKAVGRATTVLVANGDFDPVSPKDVKSLVASHRRSSSAATVICTELDHPGGYGRVIRDGGRLVRIVEHADATTAERAIKEVATNWMAFRRSDLFAALPLLERDNRQSEYYLNRVIPIFLDKGERVSIRQADTGGTLGLNSRGGLAAVERVVRDRINSGHMSNGVTLVDPSTTYIEVGVSVGPDTVVQPLSFLQGSTVVGRGCQIGPSTRIVDSRIGEGSEVTFSVVLGSTVGRDARVGPFARLRPGCRLADGTKVGAFVDVKNSSIGKGSKVPHLAYVGDASIGEGVNIGAGTITVNFDGRVKHETKIRDGASIGSDTMLIAPIRIGKDAVTGAGSVITKDVPAGALAVERGEQKNIAGYRRRKEAERGRTVKASKSKSTSRGTGRDDPGRRGTS